LVGPPEVIFQRSLPDTTRIPTCAQAFGIADARAIHTHKYVQRRTADVWGGKRERPGCTCKTRMYGQKKATCHCSCTLHRSSEPPSHSRHAAALDPPPQRRLSCFRAASSTHYCDRDAATQRKWRGCRANGECNAALELGGDGDDGGGRCCERAAHKREAHHA
jgi:hypothetical protein